MHKTYPSPFSPSSRFKVSISFAKDDTPFKSYQDFGAISDSCRIRNVAKIPLELLIRG